jgi:hypothetical protein
MAIWRSAFVALSLVVSTQGLSCARGGACEWESWRGQCKLDSVKRIRSVERFPRSFVVVEALYAPEDASSRGAPAVIRQEHTIDARHEYDLIKHLRSYASVPCAVHVRDEGVCGTSEMVVAVPGFRPQETVKQSGPSGCALLDHPVPGSTRAAEALDEPLRFDEGSATPTSEIVASVSRIAARLSSDSSIECVAVGGQNAYGEDFRLADQRARAIHQMLLDRGVASDRLRVFPAVVPTYAGTSAMERVSDPEHRRVHLTIVARTPTPAP